MRVSLAPTMHVYIGLNLGDFLFCFKLCKLDLCLQFWLRLEIGTDNIILNQVYQCNKEENHYWYQSLKYLLCINGLGNNGIARHYRPM